MYSDTLKPKGFRPDESSWKYKKEREAYVRILKQEQDPLPEEESPALLPLPEEKEKPHSLSQLIEMVAPEDSALIALIVFLLCDNTENDVVLLGILLYVLLSK